MSRVIRRPATLTIRRAPPSLLAVVVRSMAAMSLFYLAIWAIFFR